MRANLWCWCVGFLLSPSVFAASVDKSASGGKKVILLVTPAESQKMKKGDTVTLTNKKLGIEASGKISKLSAKKALIDLDEANAFKSGTKVEIAASSAGSNPDSDKPADATESASATTTPAPTTSSSSSTALPEPTYPYAPNFLSLNIAPVDRPTALPMVSPASLFKMKKPTADVGFRFLQWEEADKVDIPNANNNKTKMDGQDIELLGGFPVPHTKLSVGFRFVQNTNKTKKGDSKSTYEATIFGPMASYVVTQNLSLGFQYDISKYVIKDSTGKTEATVNIFRPGLTYFKPGLELELFYSPPIHVEEEKAYAAEPGSVIVNGRFGPKQRIIAVQVRRINFDGISEQLKDIFALRVGTESARANLTTYGGYLNFRQEAHDGDEFATGYSTQRFGLEGFFQQEIQSEGRLGVHFAYDYAPEKKTNNQVGTRTYTEKHTLSGFSIGLNGSMAF